MLPSPAVTATAALRALALANARYWPSVVPLVRRELLHWEQRAATISDPTWRTIACDKLASEHFNAQVAATLATLAPRRLRATAVRAIVAAEVLYDYLDGASEHAGATGGAHLYDAFATALGRAQHSTHDYFRDLSTDDGGYLQQLADRCREAFLQLPAATVVTAAAWEAADRCAIAQTLTHRIPGDGIGPLRAWSEARSGRQGLAWWEFAAGGAASILAVHALIAAAADRQTTVQTAEALGDAYLLSCALSTLLDSLVDQQRDLADGGHSFIAYYADEAGQASGVAAVAHKALAATAQLPHAAHHAMSVAGVAGYYLSAPGAQDPRAQATARAVERELNPTLRPILRIFTAWRLAKRTRWRPGRAE